MRRFIRLGDKTSHGGTVTSASSRMFVGGLPVACIGDTCTCPKKGHGNCVIVEGDDIMTVDGRAIALEGCKCSCGAVLISSMPNAGREYTAEAAATVSQMGSSNSSPNMGSPFNPKAASFESTNKEILRVFWTYGEDQIPVSQQSRFYSDLNIHLETRNYNAGETVEIKIDDEEASGDLSQIALNAIVQTDGSATILNALGSRRVEILAKG